MAVQLACDSPACETVAVFDDLDEVEVPKGWLSIDEVVDDAGNAATLGLFCSRPCVAFYAGMEEPVDASVS